MKFSIEWHEQNLCNHAKSLASMEAELDRMREAVQLSRERYLFAQAQIEYAKAKGLDGFDAERLLKSRPRYAARTP
jgi:hypothetical protein